MYPHLDKDIFEDIFLIVDALYVSQPNNLDEPEDNQSDNTGSHR